MIRTVYRATCGQSSISTESQMKMSETIRNKGIANIFSQMGLVAVSYTHLNDENNIRFHLGLNCGMSVCQLESMNIQENGNDIRIDIEQFCRRMCKAAKSYYDKVHLEKDFSLYNTPVLDFVQVTQKKKAASIIALICGSERYAKGLKETLQFISDQIMLFYTPESAKTRLGRHKPDLWIVTEDMTSQPNHPWRADRTTPVILITGNPDAVEIKKNSGKLTVLSMGGVGVFSLAGGDDPAICPADAL